jgi:plastocyanin
MRRATFRRPMRSKSSVENSHGWGQVVMKKLLLPFVALAVLAVGAAPATPAATATKTVQIKRSSFSPTTVTIRTGDTVRWVNSDSQNHQVVSNNGSFVSPILGPGRVYSHRFDASGTFRYHDGLNAAIRGVVKVSGPPPAVSIGASRPIVVYGESIALSGTVSNGKANEKVTLYQQPFGQASFAEMTTLLTAPGGAWSLNVSPAPKVLTQFVAKWNGRTSVVVSLAVRPRIRLGYRNGRFTTRVEAAHAFAGRVVLAQRLSRFGQWVTLRKLGLGEHSGKIFKLTLPRGRSPIRVAMSVNQAGPGYLGGFSPTVTVRRR